MDDTDTSSPFPETADIETSNDDYATRFRGATGAWMLKVQERGVLKLLGARVAPGATVLDVGGGHGQLAVPLSRAGYDVTILGSDESCRHRVRSIVDSGPARFVVGNVVNLPFSDKSFDVVISFRLMTHCEVWPRLAAELCRVARSAVIVDYPTSQSVNAIAPALFGAKKKFEKNTRTWTLFRHAQIDKAFADVGFRRAASYKQFALPMVVHRMLKCRALSAGAEAVCRAVGLTALAGSPVIARFEPANP